jgi:hypothetical protein
MGSTMTIRVRWCGVVATLIAVTIGRALSAQTQDDLAQTLFGCGPAKERLAMVKHKDRPMPGPSMGKAMVYVSRPGSRFVTPTMRLGINGHWVAVLDEETYSYIEVEPGLVRMCWTSDRAPSSWSTSRPPLSFTAEAGRTYYFEGFGNAHLLLGEVRAEDWKGGTEGWRFTTFERKP